MTLILSILLGGLGWLKSLAAFAMKHWKIALGIVAAVALFFVHQHYVHAYGEAQFKRGVDATLAQVKTEVSKRNVVNRAIEENVATNLDKFATDKTRLDDKRHDAEKKSQDKIGAAVDSVPMWSSAECSLTPQVLADRNAIRALGPKAPAATPVTGDTK